MSPITSPVSLESLHLLVVYLLSTDCEMRSVIKFLITQNIYAGEIHQTICESVWER